MNGTPRNSRATLADVASLAGVSRTAASFALNGSGRVSQATIKKVHDAARKLSYTPNTVARNLRGARLGTIALHLPPDASSFVYYSEITGGVVDAASAEGVLVVHLPTDPKHVEQALRQVDGVIVVDATDNDPSLATILSSSLPVVAGEATPALLPAPDVVIASDHRAGIQQLLNHLEARGCTFPALIAPHATTAWTRETRSGYQEWCRQRGIPVEIVDTSFPSKPDEVQIATDDLLRQVPEIDGVITLTDGTVFTAITTALAHGRTIGKDFLVASAVDSILLEHTTPSVTALDLTPHVFGERCTRELLQRIRVAATGSSAGTASANSKPRTLNHPISLNVRSSTRGEGLNMEIYLTGQRLITP